MAYLHLILFAVALASSMALPSVAPLNSNGASIPQHRVKRKQPCFGCPVEKIPDETHKKLAQESLDKFLLDLKKTTGTAVTVNAKEIKITKVTEQVVAGSMTVIDFDVYPNGGQKFSCHSEVWEKPWEHFKQITVKCDNKQ